MPSAAFGILRLHIYPSLSRSSRFPGPRRLLFSAKHARTPSVVSAQKSHDDGTRVYTTRYMRPFRSMSANCYTRANNTNIRKYEYTLTRPTGTGDRVRRTIILLFASLAPLSANDNYFRARARRMGLISSVRPTPCRRRVARNSI